MKLIRTSDIIDDVRQLLLLLPVAFQLLLLLIYRKTLHNVIINEFLIRLEQLAGSLGSLAGRLILLADRLG